jgi:hypothetical protein
MVGVMRMLEGESDSLSEMFTLLSQPRRRRLVVIMAVASDRELSLRYVAELIAAFETGETPESADRSAYHNVRQSLVKNHLHVLESQDVINRSDNTLTRGPAFDQLARLLFLSGLANT